MNKFALVCLVMFGVGYVSQQTIATPGSVVEEHTHSTGCGCGKPKPKG